MMNEKQQFVLIACAVIGILAMHSTAAIIPLSPVADATIHNLAPDTNYGTESVISTGDLVSGNTYYAWRTFMKFDLSAVPDDQTVTAAVLHMYQVDGVGFNSSGTDAAYVSDDTWGETSVTWNNQPSYGAVLGACPDNKDHRDWSQWDLLGNAQWNWSDDLTDNTLSLLMKESGGSSSHNWYSKDEADDTSYLPYLELTYVPEPATVGVLAVGLAVGLFRRSKTLCR